MDDEVMIEVSLTVDDDGFITRECPNCHRNFKWHVSDEGSGSGPVDHYHCPLCGELADADDWWTADQREYLLGLAGPQLDQAMLAAAEDAFRGARGVEFKANRDFSLGIPTISPPSERDGMVIVEPPCHPEEPLKVPESATTRVYCVICGEPFAA